jgi:hypothetical protein
MQAAGKWRDLREAEQNLIEQMSAAWSYTQQDRLPAAEQTRRKANRWNFQLDRSWHEEQISGTRVLNHTYALHFASPQSLVGHYGNRYQQHEQFDASSRATELHRLHI